MNWNLAVQYRRGDFSMDVSLTGRAETLAVIGPNGAGKTTLLRLLAGAHLPDHGQWVCGQRTLFDSERGIHLPPEQRRMGYVPQGSGLFTHLSVLDNVGFGWIPQGMSRAHRHEKGRVLLKAMGIGHLIGRSVSTLSGGEQQRVALARALAVEPDILLLDEPLGALDVVARQEMRIWLAEHLQRQRAPTILVTHDVRDVYALAERVAVIEDGRVTQVDALKTVVATPKTPFVSGFFAAMNNG